MLMAFLASACKICGRDCERLNAYALFCESMLVPRCMHTVLYLEVYVS